MEQLKLIILREYIAKVRNKAFIIMTILSPLIMVGFAAVVAFLIQYNNKDKKIIALLNESTFFSDEFTNSGGISFIKMDNLSLDKAKDSVNRIGYYGLLYIPNKSSLENTLPDIELFTEGTASITTLRTLESRISKRIRKEKLKKYGVSQEEMDDISADYNLKNANFYGKQNVKGVNEIRSFIGAAFGYIIMMFIFVYGAFVMRSVIEEKTSRIIEVIISSVKPFQLMLGKIIGNALAGITQFTIWIFSVFILFSVATAILGINTTDYMGSTNLPPETMEAMEAIQKNSSGMEKIKIIIQEVLDIPWITLIISFFLYFSLGYLIYSSIYAAIGAAVDSETDTQQFMLPVILPIILAVYVGFFSVFSNPHGPIAVGFSLFPLTSPIVMLMRIPADTPVPTWQILLSLALLIGTFLLLVWIASKIYRVGILMYGKKPTYKDLYKWLKY